MASSSSSSSRSWKYDVFLSFRGEDTRKTFVDHLYFALKRRLIRTYKDDETLPRGDTISTSLLNAINDSQIAIIIFSENYASSSWCLDELAYILKCKRERGQVVMPLFYHVDPMDVRKQKGKYGEAFAKHELENNIKIESWRKALVDASNIAGWDPNHIANGHEAKGIEDIVGTILDKFLSLNPIIDENLVGMGTRLQNLKSQLSIGSGGVRMIGIWGIGGGGKTTLASSLYVEIRSRFDSCCFVGNIKDVSKHGMETLQNKILSTVFDKEVKVDNVDIGKLTIKGMLCHRNVLIVLDDVDDRKQLEALAGSHDWFGDGSRIIITTRDEHLLITHRVDEVSHVNLLSDEEAIMLFNRSAYNKNNPVDDYDMFSLRVVTYAGGLPLALTVLGSFLYDKNKEEWISTLDRLENIPEMEIVEKLKISYDGLKPIEKELFLEIACFFRGTKKDDAMVMLDACGFYPDIGLKVLIQKALITISPEDGSFDMHDLVQEMGHYIVRGEHPYNPEKHTRLWRYEDIEDMCYGNATMENNITEAIICYKCPSGFGKVLSNMKKIRLLYVRNYEGDIEELDFLSNELRYISCESYSAGPFLESFHPRKLVVLRLEDSLQEEIWRGYKSLPCLKELHLSFMRNLVTTPDFGGLPCLEKLTIEHCDKLEEIHSSLGNCTSLVYVFIYHCYKLRKFPTIVEMGKLKILKILYCDALCKFPKIEANMDSLVELSLREVGIEHLPSSVGEYCTNLRSLMLMSYKGLKSTEGIFRFLKHLVKFGDSKQIVRLPKDIFFEKFRLRKLKLCHWGLKDGEIPCNIGELSNLQELDLSCNKFSRLNFSLSQLTRLKELNVECCNSLVELPELPSNIAILNADFCSSLTFIGDNYTNYKCLWQVSLRWVRHVIGGDTLLQTMLQGNAIKNGCMSLLLRGFEIPNGFTPPLLRKGNSYRLELPANWYNHFSGFFICAIIGRGKSAYYRQTITMKHKKGGMDSEQDVFWEESVDAKKDKWFKYVPLKDILFWDLTSTETWIGYVSFNLLKHTIWWNPTSNVIEFSSYSQGQECSGIGVLLVSKTASDSSSESSDDSTRGFCIKHDSKSHLECTFSAIRFGLTA